jgi:hypothetical protein
MKRTPLRRRTPLTRRTPLRARISDPYVLRKAKKIVRECSRGRCEIAIPGLCTGEGTEAHDVKLRSRGGKHDPANLLWADRPCHQFVTDHPHWAAEDGFVKHSWED